MKSLLIIAIFLLLTTGVWLTQHQRRLSTEEQNKALQAQIAVLKATRDDLESACEKKVERQKQVLAEAAVSSELSKTNKQPRELIESSRAPVPPDPSRRGGWVQQDGFFYFPKQLLAQVDFRTLNNHTVTDEAAVLFGMSDAERSQVNASLQHLLESFRSTELARMQPIQTPEHWSSLGSLSGGTLGSAITYALPALADEVDSLRATFNQQLQNTLGPNRANAFQEAIDAHLQSQLDNLGRQERQVGFLWIDERDGTKSLWYGFASGPKNSGNFQRVPTDVAPDSQIAYYARLFGVSLPQREP